MWILFSHGVVNEATALGFSQVRSLYFKAALFSPAKLGLIIFLDQLILWVHLPCVTYKFYLLQYSAPEFSQFLNKKIEEQANSRLLLIICKALYHADIIYGIIPISILRYFPFFGNPLAELKAKKRSGHDPQNTL